MLATVSQPVSHIREDVVSPKTGYYALMTAEVELVERDAR
jgi:hypothetical protein